MEHISAWLPRPCFCSFGLGGTVGEQESEWRSGYRSRRANGAHQCVASAPLLFASAVHGDAFNLR